MSDVKESALILAAETPEMILSKCHNQNCLFTRSLGRREDATVQVRDSGAWPAVSNHRDREE